MADGRLVFEDTDIPRLMGGDPETVRVFASYYGELLHIKLRSRFRDLFWIDDIRQETLLRVLTTLRDDPGSISQPDLIGRYVNAVCRNVILERFRLDGRHLPSTPDPEKLEIPDQSADLEANLINSENQELVSRVLEDLPERDRQLLTEICQEDHDKAEICRRHGVDRGYLRVLLFRARNRLKDLLVLRTRKKF
jgi:RNA polymerase sigma-70 factor, ECF subfamily